MKRKTTNSPYPVLYPADEAYKSEQGYSNARFDVKGDPDVRIDPQTNNLWIQFDFDLVEPTLKDLVVKGDATYYVNVECGSTYYRKAVVQSGEHFRLEIPYFDVSGSLEIFVGVVAARDISGFHADGFESRFGQATFDLEKGDILAAAAGWDVELEELDGDASPYIYVARDEAETQHNVLWVDGSSNDLVVYLAKDLYDIYYNRAKTNKFKNLFVALVMKPAILSALQMEISGMSSDDVVEADDDVESDDEEVTSIDTKGKRWLRKLDGLFAKVMDQEGHSWDINKVECNSDRETNTLSFAVERVLQGALKCAMVDINEKLGAQKMKVPVFNLKINDVLTTLGDKLLPVYRNGDIDDIEKLASYFDEQGAVDTLDVACPDFSLLVKLDMTQKESHATDFENVKRLYEGLKLPPNIAAKPEFWGWYAHAYQADYVVYRSEEKRENYTEHSVKRDFFCRSKEQPRRRLVVNLLSRLWWTGRLMYDYANRANPYHFVDLVTKSDYNAKIMLLASSTASSNHDIFMGLLDAVQEFKGDRQLDKVSRYYFISCTKYLNSIGAVKMIDTLSRQEIKNVCLDVLNRTYPQ